ncbi:MAG: hypothetical protein AB7I50_04315 [Vicinamibacterales bacterium]
MRRPGFNGLRVTPDGGFLVTGQFTSNVLEYGADGSLTRAFDPANAAGASSLYLYGDKLSAIDNVHQTRRLLKEGRADRKLN